MPASANRPKLALDPFFLHERLVSPLLPPARDRVAEEEIARRLRSATLPPAVVRETVLARELAGSLAQISPPELGRLYLRGRLIEGQVVGVQQAFYFRRVPRAHDQVEQLEFHGKLNIVRSMEVSGRLNVEHIASSSGRTNLSGQVRVYILGYVSEASSKKIQLRPIFIGRRYYSSGEAWPFEGLDNRRVFPSEVDQFARIDAAEVSSRSDLRLLKQVPEAQVKKAFAELIGEGSIPKVWGGEKSDLYTARIKISGNPTSAAFMFKGPSFFRPMTIAALGKNGDQIDRLYREPADVLVLQHCHEVRAEVANMMEVYAWDARRPRRYMLIDGFDTIRILRAYGRL